MSFSSSPVVYPPSSSPPVPPPARKRPADDLAEPDHQQQPQPKKRLFGTTLWDAANILRAQPVMTKTTEIDNQPAALRERAPATTDARERAVFRDPRRHAPDIGLPEKVVKPVEKDSGIQGEKIGVSADGNGWSFSRLGSTKDGEVVRGRTCSGKQISLHRRKPRESKTYERIIAERSTTAPGRATTSYYGIDIHSLLDQAQELEKQPRLELPSADMTQPSVEEGTGKRRNKHAMWTEKYRARKFVDLVGDERTHRTVLRWLKGWDSIVFPGTSKPVVKGKVQDDEETMHRKILLLTGPPGLGKTTLAHVCAKQAGYEVVEINASDERSRDVVKGRIRDCVGTENVRGISTKNGEKIVRKSGKPVCVVVDEVDGVVTGSGGAGDGGFMKALIDLIQLDQKNSQWSGADSAPKKGKKGDRFRLLRPMILVCNDVYHPSLRPLRASNLAEIVHVRKAPLDKVVSRLKTVFEREGVASDTDGVRRLCEATWAVSGKRNNEMSRSAGEGDLRGVLVVGEWAARKLRASAAPRISRAWVERNMIADLGTSGSGARGVGRGGTKETAERVFLENAGFSKTATAAVSVSGTNERDNRAAAGVNSVSDAARANAMNLLRAAIDATGEPDRIAADVFSAYPSRPFQDDTFLSKPNAAAEWLHFHDMLSSRVHSGQEWELAPYLSAPLLGLHHLFGSTNQFNAHASGSTGDADAEALPFRGPKADFEAHEAQKATRATLQSVHGNLAVPLFRAFRGPEDLATDLVPYLSRMLAPNVSPVIVGGSSGARGTASVRRAGEKDMVLRAAQAMCATGVSFEKARVEETGRGAASTSFVLRMEPPIDTLTSFATADSASSSGPSAPAPARYAVRQVLDQEHARAQAVQAAAARQARMSGTSSASGTNASDSASISSAPALSIPGAGGAPGASASTGSGPAEAIAPLKRDFFGRVVASSGMSQGADSKASANTKAGRATIWVTFHEGFSNAVRKPVGLREVMGMF